MDEKIVEEQPGLLSLVMNVQKLKMELESLKEMVVATQKNTCQKLDELKQALQGVTKSLETAYRNYDSLSSRIDIFEYQLKDMKSDLNNIANKVRAKDENAEKLRRDVLMLILRPVIVSALGGLLMLLGGGITYYAIKLFER